MRSGAVVLGCRRVEQEDNIGKMLYIQEDRTIIRHLPCGIFLDKNKQIKLDSIWFDLFSLMIFNDNVCR